jgi:hypothetical protein
VAQRRRLVGLSAAAAAAAAAAVVVGLLATAASPPSAYAAAKQAIAATAALPSGTMTLSGGMSTGADGTPLIATVRWSGKDLAIASGTGGNVLPGFDQLLLVGGALYLQRPDGSWLHYASGADLAPLLDRGDSPGGLRSCGCQPRSADHRVRLRASDDRSTGWLNRLQRHGST